MSEDNHLPNILGEESDNSGGEVRAVEEEPGETTELDRIGLPSSFEDLPAERFDADLTLLPSEPATPSCISREEHAQYLLGYARQELTDREWYTDFMFHLWGEVNKTLELEFRKHVPTDDGRSYEWLSSRGVREPEDLMQIDTAKELFDELFEEFVTREPLLQYNKTPRLDRAIAEELYRIDLLDIGYLKKLPTEPEPNHEAYDRIETHLTGRAGAVQRSYGRSKKLDKHLSGVPDLYNAVQRNRENTHRGKYNLVHDSGMTSYSPEEVDFLLERLRELPEKQFYQDFMPGFFGSVILRPTLDMFSYYFVAKDTEQLNKIGYEGPEDVFCREQVLEDICSAKELWEDNEMPFGPFTSIQSDLATSAHKGYSLIDEETYKQLR